MAVKQKPAETGIPAALIAAQVDELGALEKELAPWKPKIARVEALRKAIRGQFDASAADQAFEAAGERFNCAVGHRAFERTVNVPKLVKAIGMKAVAAIARVTITALEASVTADVAASVITGAHSGPRSLTVYERPRE